MLGVLQAPPALGLYSSPIPLALLVQLADVVGGSRAGLTAGPALSRALGQQAGGVDDEGRVDGEAAELEDVLADGGGDDELAEVGRLAAAVGPHHARPRRPCPPAVPAGRAHLALDHKVRHDVQPLAVPRQDPAPHLVPLQRRDLAPEAAEHGPQPDPEGALHQLAVLVAHPLVLGVVADDGHPRLQEVRDQVRPADVQVGKVGRVALVDVVVGLEERRARR